MRRESRNFILTNAIALRSATSWLRWPCMQHEWIEIGRHDDRVSERCAHCDKQRHWHLPRGAGSP